MKKTYTSKLWGAGFSEQPSEAVIAFTSARDVAGLPPSDEALLPYDIWVNKAHVLMLAKQGIIPASDAVKILGGLSELESLVKRGKFTLDPGQEDVHTNIESWLTQQLGIDIAGRMHTGRSRNDQIAADMSLYLKDQALVFGSQTISLAKTLLKLAEQHIDTIIPGFTHHQHAMVTTLGHLFVGFAGMIVRDAHKFQHWVELHNSSPLGSMVAYGTSFPIDSVCTAGLLGFRTPAENSMDAIMNRWEAEADLGYAIGSLMNHLSSLAQTLILWATPEFGMITISDTFSTGSSIMPQKKNPDPLEVMKGKASSAHGQIMSLMGIGKANFIGYNRDTQWTKYIIMDLTRECMPAPVVMKGVLQTLTVHKDVMAGWCQKGMIGATSLLEQFAATNHIPLRVAKGVVEKAITYAQESGEINYGALVRAIKENKLDIAVTRKQVRDWQDPQAILDATHSFGGPGKDAMKVSQEILTGQCQAFGLWLAQKYADLGEAKTKLTDEISHIFEKENI